MALYFREGTGVYTLYPSAYGSVKPREPRIDLRPASGGYTQITTTDMDGDIAVISLNEDEQEELILALLDIKRRRDEKK